MKDLGKIIRNNLLILLGYTLLIFLLTYTTTSSSNGYAGMEYAIFMMIAIGVHAFVCLIIMIVKFAKKEKEVALSYLVTLFVVAIVGFSSCFGGSTFF